jgi:transcriptional regulator with XRE-family HTH domain
MGSTVALKICDPIDIHVGARIRMRRLMLSMSQTKLGDALGVTFQQVQKYESGFNRVGASRLQQVAIALQVPVAFFFEGLPTRLPNHAAAASAISPSVVYRFLGTSDGLDLVNAFTRIKNPKLRRCIVRLAEQIGG